MDASKTPLPKRKRDVVNDEEDTDPAVATAGSHNKVQPQKKARKFIVIDGDDTEDDDSSSQPVAPSLASPDTTWLIRADDRVKNQVLVDITDPTIQTAYLHEVGDRTLYITNDPFPPGSTASDSAASPEVRAALRERLVNNATWNGCIEAYNGNGGNVANFAGVEKGVKLHAWKWFGEQNVVVPWGLKDAKEKKRLQALGLDKHHFPTLKAPTLNSTVTSSSQSVAQPGIPKAEPKKPPPKVEEDDDQLVEEQSALTPSKEHSEPDASNFATHEQQSVDDNDDDDNNQEDAGYKADTTNLLIRDRIRATYNLYGIIPTEKPEGAMTVAYDRNWVEVKLDGTSTFATITALEKYCGAYNEQTESSDDEVVDFGCKRVSPMIARAFFQAISPFPRNELPSHDVILDPEMGLHHEDVALVILPDDPAPKNVDWNLKSCAEMYKLAVALKSPVVKNMVADKILSIYLDYCKQEDEESGQDDEDCEPKDKKSFDFPVRFANSLTMEDDLPLLRLLVDIAIDHCRRGHGQLDGFAKHVLLLLEGRVPGWGGKMNLIYKKDQAALCNEYHIQTHGQLCHKAIDALNPTKGLIEDIFLQIHLATLNQAEEEFAEEAKKTRLDDQFLSNDIYRLLLWARENEKRVALLMLEYEELVTKLDATWERDEEADPKDEQRAKALSEEITALRLEHHERWPTYEEEEGEERGPADYARLVLYSGDSTRFRYKRIRNV